MKKMLKTALFCVVACFTLAACALPVAAAQYDQTGKPLRPAFPFETVELERYANGSSYKTAIGSPFANYDALGVDFMSPLGDMSGYQCNLVQGSNGGYHTEVTFMLMATGSATFTFRANSFLGTSDSMQGFMGSLFFVDVGFYGASALSGSYRFDANARCNYTAFGSTLGHDYIVRFNSRDQSYSNSGTSLFLQYNNQYKQRLYAYGLNDAADDWNSWRLATNNNNDQTSDVTTPRYGASRISGFEYQVSVSFPEYDGSQLQAYITFEMALLGEEDYVEWVFGNRLDALNEFVGQNRLLYVVSENDGQNGMYTFYDDMKDFGGVFSALVPAAASVLDTPFFGSWSLGMIGLVVVGISLIVFFIKMFAGG